MNDISANDYEKRALIGMAPVDPDGSFRIKVPANTPLSFATLDQNGRGFVVKRTHLFVRPGENFDRCTGCHEDRIAGGQVPTNPNPMAASHAPFDLNVAAASWQVIDYQNTIGSIVAAKCATCHFATYTPRQVQLPDSSWITVIDTTAAPGNLDLTAAPDTVRGNRVFPRGYVNLSGEMMAGSAQVTTPGFPRRSKLIDYVMGLGSHAGQGSHPAGADSLTAVERRQFNLWVLMGAQYR